MILSYEGPKHVYVTYVVINAQQSAVLCSQLKVFPSFLNLFEEFTIKFCKMIILEIPLQN